MVAGSRGSGFSRCSGLLHVCYCSLQLLVATKCPLRCNSYEGPLKGLGGPIPWKDEAEEAAVLLSGAEASIASSRCRGYPSTPVRAGLADGNRALEERPGAPQMCGALL